MMSNCPKISVIIPCINSENTIQKTFDSLKMQNYENLECIVIDGGSSDKTLHIIEKNRNIIDIFISEKDSGAPDAQNKGIKLATGDLIGFLHSDDYYVSSMLHEVCKAYLDYKDFDLITYGIEIESLQSKKTIMSSCSKKNLDLNLNNILFKHAMGHFYKKENFIKNGFLKTKSKNGGVMYANDREFLIKLCLLGKKNHVVEKILYKMGAHKDSNTLSRNNIVAIRYEHIDIANVYMNLYRDSIYKFNKLKEFKAHNLSLLFTYYVLTLSAKKAFGVFRDGYKLKKFSWFFCLILCPLREFLYRASVKKWL